MTTTTTTTTNTSTTPDTYIIKLKLEKYLRRMGAPFVAQVPNPWFTVYISAHMYKYIMGAFVWILIVDSRCTLHYYYYY